MKKQTLAEHIGALCVARANCERMGNPEWHAKHTAAIHLAVKDHLPSGSGFDNGTRIDMERSNASRLVFDTAFHHMHESGMYDGWTDHRVTVRPSFLGLDITISGRERNQIKDLIADAFLTALSEEVQS